MERIKLDLVPSCIKPVLHASQYDDGRQWQCDILNGGTPYVFQNGDTVELNLRKGDGLVVTSAVAVVPGQSYVILVSTEQMCAIYGSNLGELKLKSNGVDIGSCNFILEVEKDTTGGDKKSVSQIYDLPSQVDACVTKELKTVGAKLTGYDNTSSGLTATNVQDALDELASQPSVDAYTKQESDAFITDEYDAESTYAIGDMVIHENALYVCSTAITTAEAWNSAHWTLTDIATAIGTVKTAIPTKTSQLQNDSGFAQIDDSEESASKTYSSNKIEAELDTKASIIKDIYIDKAPAQTYSGYRMSYRTEGSGAGLCYIAVDASHNCKAYKVEAGQTYKVQAYGYDVDSFYMGAIGESLVNAGQSTTEKQVVLCGGSTYPTDYKNHIIEFTAQYTGYLYLNERISTGVSAYAKGNEKVNARNENGLIINNGTYTHFVYLGEGKFLIRNFARRGPNNLFQLVHVGLGYFVDGTFVETKSYMTASTDIIGPFSIDKVGWSGGVWTGGNHSVTVDNVACPTAEQLSLSVTVNNEAVSNNGTYYGDIKIIAKNKLYFAQTITGNTFEGATPAILETRLYNLTDTMKVEVYIELLDDVRFSKYHGMQYVNSNVVNVVVPDDETIIVLDDLASNYSMTHKQPDIILQYAGGEELHMILHSAGLGSYAHNNGNEYYGLVATYGKTYHTLISSETIATGSKLYWSGEYKMIV